MSADQHQIRKWQTWRRKSDGRLATILDSTEVARGLANPRIVYVIHRRTTKLVRDFRRAFEFVREPETSSQPEQESR